MQTFRDSTALLSDSQALASRLNEQGYLFLKGLFSREQILDVRAQLLEKAAAGGWLRPGTDSKQGIADPTAACKDPEERYMRVYRGIWNDETLHRLRIEPRVLNLFERIFGEPALVHPMFVQRNIFPQSDTFDFTTGMHQDKVHIGGATNHALWVPLGDCPIEKGPLAVAAGSHAAGVLDTKVGSGAGGMDICVPIPGTWVTGDFSAGDALVFSDTTVHQALPNHTPELRMSFDARYQPVSLPVAETNMRPYSGCGAWSDVYAQWSSPEDQYYWESLPLEVVPLDMQYYERRDEMAFSMAEHGDLGARDALLRIVQRDSNPTKRERAAGLLAELDASAA